jgi:hypothetical protein
MRSDSENDVRALTSLEMDAIPIVDRVSEWVNEARR